MAGINRVLISNTYSRPSDDPWSMIVDPWEESLVITKRKNRAFELKVKLGRETLADSGPFRTAAEFFEALDYLGYEMNWTELQRPTDAQVRLLLPGLWKIDRRLEGDVREMLATGTRPSDDDDPDNPRSPKPVAADDVVDAVLARSECAESLLCRWFDQGPDSNGEEMTESLEELESGGIVLWNEIARYQEVDGIDALEGRVSARRWERLNAEADSPLTARERTLLARENMRRYLEEPVEGWGWQIFVMPDTRKREAYLPVLKHGDAMEGVDVSLVGAYATVDQARSALKRHGIIDADDYRGPQQIGPPLPRHEHSGREVPWVGKAKPGSRMRFGGRKRYLAIKITNPETAEGMIVGIHFSSTRALGTCMTVRTAPTAVRLAAPGWHYRRGQTVTVGDLKCPYQS